MTLWKLLMKKIAPSPKLLEHKRYLFIGPHPDDIEIGAGATAARLCQMGKEVYFIIATDGRYGTEDASISPEELVQIRQKEAKSAAKLLGVKQTIFLPFSDGGMYTTEEMTRRLALEIANIQPDVVFCPDPHLKTECHSDHLKVGMATSNAFIISNNYHMTKELGASGIAHPIALAYYYTDRPNAYVGVRKWQKRQFDALAKHSSQFTYTNDGKGTLNLLMLYLKLRSIRYGLIRGRGRVECFRALNLLHIHCCAEKV